MQSSKFISVLRRFPTVRTLYPCIKDHKAMTNEEAVAAHGGQKSVQYGNTIYPLDCGEPTYLNDFTIRATPKDPRGFDIKIAYDVDFTMTYILEDGTKRTTLEPRKKGQEIAMIIPQAQLSGIKELIIEQTRPRGGPMKILE